MSLHESVAAVWRARSTRERMFLGSAASILAVALLYVLVWEPGITARRKLSTALPAMRAQLEDMRLQQKEVIALRRQIESAPQRAELKVLLQDSAARTSFAKSVERIEAAAPERVLFAAGPVEFDAWLDWATSMQRDFGARVDASTIVATKQAGLVRVEATFVARNVSAAPRVP